MGFVCFKVADVMNQPMIREAGAPLPPLSAHVTLSRSLRLSASIGRVPRPRPFACNLTSCYSDTLFRVADHFTMRRHNTTRGSNFKRREQIGCKTVQDGSNSLPTNQLPRTIVWSSPRIPRASSAGWMQLVGVAAASLRRPVARCPLP